MLTTAKARGQVLYAVNRAAAQAGLQAGMTLADARALIPRLPTRPADPGADAAALDRLAIWCTRYTPWTNVDGRDGLWLEVTGCAHLFGGETAMLADMRRRFVTAGIDARPAIAATAGAAWALARHGNGQERQEGDLEAVLSALPVAALRLSAEAVADLRRLGLTHIGQLTGLGRTALARRFSKAGIADQVLTRLDQALGRREEPISPLVPVPEWRTRQAFAEPVGEAGLAGAVPGMVDDLLDSLGKAGRGLRRMTLSAFRSDGKAAAITIAASRPTRNRDHILRLINPRLEQIDTGFGIDAACLAADITAPLPECQGNMTGTGPADDGEGLARLVDRLTNHLGVHSLSRPGHRESHLPERAERRLPALDSAPIWPQGGPETPPRPLCLFDRPEPIEVMAEIPDGPPLTFTWRRVVRRVARAEGPERIAPEWWRDHSEHSPEMRDYYRVEDSVGRRYWVFRAGLYQDATERGLPRWFVHGLYG